MAYVECFVAVAAQTSKNANPQSAPTMAIRYERGPCSTGPVNISTKAQTR